MTVPHYRTGINGNPSADNTCETYYWTCQDSNYNVIGLLDSSGNLKERYEYTPYGQRTVYKPTGTGDTRCRATLLESQRVVVSGVEQPWSLCDFGFQGKLFDKEFGRYITPTRTYNPVTGRWDEPDPTDYPDGMNRFESYASNPLTALDWSGLKVYWAARDLASSPLGNHHFILAIPDDPSLFQTIDLGGGKRGFTLAGDKKDNRLQFERNMEGDVAATKEVFDKTTKWYKADYDLESHEVPPSQGMKDTEFIRTLENQANNYAINENRVHLEYRLGDYPYHYPAQNCATWVNSMFKYAGIPEAVRLEKGEFSGSDWGEENVIPKLYFMDPSKWSSPKRAPKSN